MTRYTVRKVRNYDKYQVRTISPDGKIVVLSTHGTLKEAKIERIRLVLKYIDELVSDESDTEIEDAF